MRLASLFCLVSMLGLFAVTNSGCGKRGAKGPKAAAKTANPPPSWVTNLELSTEKLCGVGVAGPGFDEFSPYPRQLSRERAVRNLAGILGTSVLEAIVDRNSELGQSIEMARTLQIDDTLIARIDALAKTEYWTDVDAAGPFAQKNFVYAHACADASKAAATLKLDIKKLVKSARPAPARPDKTPSWINAAGKQPGGRLCAVGFSLPMFYAENTFEGVVEDIRGQLAEVIETLVSQYSEELTTDRTQALRIMTVASTQAIAKGVVVTNFWFDRDGCGPHRRPRSTYGWGCVYPVDIMEQSVAAVAEEIRDENTVAMVKERAASAFDELDAESVKHAQQAAAITEKRAESPSAAVAPAP